MKLPDGAVRVGREHAVRLTAGMNEPLAPRHGEAVYSVPIDFWWRRAEEPAAAVKPPQALTR
ncbi:MAG TPA: hypothetical protein VG735_13185 [Caulobacterales bacterium]|nr:hypothetical protein [Caulobacterales bacterium]